VRGARLFRVISLGLVAVTDRCRSLSAQLLDADAIAKAAKNLGPSLSVSLGREPRSGFRQHLSVPTSNNGDYSVHSIEQTRRPSMFAFGAAVTVGGTDDDSIV
jgi:hypothetical protein